MKTSDITRRGFLGGAFAVVSAAAWAGPARGSFRFDAAPKVEDWLNAHPLVRESISWFFPGNTPNAVDKKTYSSWSAGQKQSLQESFDSAWIDQYMLLDDPPINLSPKTSYPATVLKPIDAWAYYLSSVALSLAVEIGDRLPWSVTGYATDSLALIFDAGSLFIYDAQLKGMRIRASENGYFTPSPPVPLFQFLKSIGVTKAGSQPASRAGANTTSLKLPTTAASAQRQALGKLFDWCRANLTHAAQAGDPTVAQMENIWQYSGFPPLSRIIAATIDKGSNSGYNPPRHWTAGCIGTTGFLSGVLRTVNIPVKHVQSCQHSIPFFPSVAVGLTHGDDLYNSFAKIYPNQPASFASTDLLISQQQFNTWIGPGAANACVNIGRRPAELGLQYLPYEVMIAYCKDKKANAAKANGEVFKLFEKYYSVAQLDAADLWGRLEQKLAAGFNCGGYS